MQVSTAGGAGARLPSACRSRWSTGQAGTSRRWLRRLRAPSSADAGRPTKPLPCRLFSHRPGFFCQPAFRPCRRVPCAGTPPARSSQRMARARNQTRRLRGHTVNSVPHVSTKSGCLPGGVPSILSASARSHHHAGRSAYCGNSQYARPCSRPLATPKQGQPNGPLTKGRPPHDANRTRGECPRQPSDRGAL